MILKSVGCSANMFIEMLVSSIYDTFVPSGFAPSILFSPTLFSSKISSTLFRYPFSTLHAPLFTVPLSLKTFFNLYVVIPDICGVHSSLRNLADIWKDSLP